MSKKRQPKGSYIPLVGIDKRYLRYLRNFKALLAGSIVFIFMRACLDVITPWSLKFIIDNVLGGIPFTGLAGTIVIGVAGSEPKIQTIFLGLILLLLTILQGVARFCDEYLVGLIQERATFRLRSDVFDHVQRLPIKFFDESRLGDVIKRVTDDSSKVMRALVGSAGTFLVDSIKLLGFACVLVFVNWRFSLIVFAYIPPVLYIYIVFRAKIRSTARVARKQEGEMMNLTMETLGAIREVKSFGREPEQLDSFEQHGRERIRSALHSIRWEAAFNPVLDLVQAVSTTAVIWYGVVKVLDNQLTVGELVVFMSYLKEMYRPLRHYSKLTSVVQKAAASAERLSKVLDLSTDFEADERTGGVHRFLGNVTFDNVSFSYPGAKDTPVLKGLSLDVPAGKTIALVGKTGAGKSTISQLLMRFYDVTEGQILIDGYDIKQFKLGDLRRQFAVVPQESVLFAASIYENIAYGRSDATDAEIFHAAKLANAHEFIQKLPEGYDTVIGERGATLSGGQRQRVSIARAVLRDAPILILDEPTAALDANSEQAVMEAMHRLMQGCTTFIVAHRLSTIQQADLIAVMSNGTIIEIGNHAALMQANGVYAEMVTLQLGVQ